MNPSPSSENIMKLGMAFWGSKTLLSAVELEIFTVLARQPMGADALQTRLGLHPRSARDFFDALFSLGMLERKNGLYTNTPDTDLFLDKAKPSYIGGFLEMANARLYRFWGSLTEGLKTGLPQNEAKEGGDFFGTLYADTAKLKNFLQSMTGLSMGASKAIAQQFPWDQYQTFFDIGSAQGGLVVQVALAHPHITGGGFDLSPTGQIFEEYIQSFHLKERLQFIPGNFFTDPLPKADVLAMGHILHDWDLEEKKRLIGKAYDALPEGGALIIFESLIDDERRSNAFGLLMSLNM
ncbi:MAG: methyltransferase, partial [Nitrospirales bacterium]